MATKMARGRSEFKLNTTCYEKKKINAYHICRRCEDSKLLEENTSNRLLNYRESFVPMPSGGITRFPTAFKKA